MYIYLCSLFCFFFFFNDTATTEIYTLSLHDALPISDLAALKTIKHEHLLERTMRDIARNFQAMPLVAWMVWIAIATIAAPVMALPTEAQSAGDRKSTRLNSSH